MHRETATALDRFSRRYRDARRQEGWQSIPEEVALILPYASPSSHPPLYWRVRRQSYRALTSWLSQDGPSPKVGPAADLGAGTGWLAYRLADLGYRALALEASPDQEFGLGASAIYRAKMPSRFLPVQGDLDNPPLQREKLGLAIFNASLHYTKDLNRTLCLAVECLRPGGWLVILDTPIARHPRPGTGRGDRHLGRGELQQALEARGLDPRWIPVTRGIRWCIHRAKVWLKRDPLFSFPMIVARANATGHKPEIRAHL
jgi:SAM-dependent methyltransferase